MASNHIDPEIYDDEAFVGIQDGEILEGKVVDDLNDDGVSDLAYKRDWCKLNKLHASMPFTASFRHAPRTD
jgi:hypothetical protein